MARQVFYSFHYKPDSFRVAKVRQIGAIEGNKSANDNDWEKIESGTKEERHKKIKKWIDDQITNKSCTIVLIGKDTAKRYWIDYEIKESWKRGKGLLGIHIHNLLDHNQEKTTKGTNPFSHFTIGEDQKKKDFDSIVKCYNPPYTNSKDVYAYISQNIENWIEEAIKIRNAN